MSSFNKNAVLKIMFFKKIGFLLQQSQLSVGRLHFLYLIIFYISHVYIGKYVNMILNKYDFKSQKV